ncbi:MAG TPA: V-type ATP synthase subunit F [Longimicrobiales bacterium]
MTRCHVRALAQPAYAAGFRLAGLPVDEAESEEAAARIFAGIARDRRTGVVLVQEEIASLLPEGSTLPLIVRLPATTWRTSQEVAAEYIAELLRSAVGYHVRVR